MKKINIHDAEAGMILAKSVTVLDKSGVELMSAGFMLQLKHIKQLKRWGIEHIFIETYDDKYTSEAVFPESIRFLAHQTYEDAIASITKMASSLLSKGDLDLGDVSKNVSNVLDVISMEPGLLSLLSMVKKSEEYIYQHSVDVCVVSLIIARYMDCSREDLLMLGTACLLHDIGLLQVHKDSWDNCMIGKEPVNVAKHPALGRDTAAQISGIDDKILSIIEQHHEFADGSGYPYGLTAKDIAPLTSILCITEAYVTLISPFKKAHACPPHEAVSAILDPKHNRFAPSVLRAFISNISIYPTGTFVHLHNGVSAVVVSSNTDKPLRPKILVILDDHNKPVKPFPVDLGDQRYKDWFIEKVMPGQDVTDVLGKILQF